LGRRYRHVFRQDNSHEGASNKVSLAIRAEMES